MKRLFKIFSSLRLTVVLLALSIVLVFVGTIAQADEGLYIAQARYFKQWLVFGITLFGKHLPIALPGGYLLGTLLLMNLITAHIARFQFTKKKIGIHLAHLGIILLLVGQLVTDMFARETQLRFREGESKMYSEAPADYELAFITSADEKSNEEILIPASRLKPGAEVTNARMPLKVQVKAYFKNSEPAFRAPMTQNTPPLATNGIALNFDFKSIAETKRMDDKNVPTAKIEIIGPNGSLGEWVVSGWAGDDLMVDQIDFVYSRQLGKAMARSIVSRMTQPQTVEVNGKKYEFTLRPHRVYTPYSLTLLKATHLVYRGTDEPKDFRSRVRIDNPQTGEKREVEIFMNEPLRYAGKTYYQYQMSAGEAARHADRIPSSTLQVVRNPAWVTPYVGCILVAAGLVVQFMMHLIGFVSKSQERGRPRPQVAESKVRPDPAAGGTVRAR